MGEEKGKKILEKSKYVGLVKNQDGRCSVCSEPLSVIENGKKVNIRKRLHSSFEEFYDTDFSFLNIGTGISTSVKTLAETMIDLSGKTLELTYDNLPLGDVKDSLADVSLAKQLINWNYETLLKNGLKKFFF